jgi:hypothetical protein
MSASAAWRGFQTAGRADGAGVDRTGVAAVGAGMCPGADAEAGLEACLEAEEGAGVDANVEAGTDAPPAWADRDGTARTPGAGVILSSRRSGAPLASTPPRRERIV